MLITVKEMKELYKDKDFSKFSDERLERKLASIETAIRKYTHNPFQNRFKRVYAISIDKVVYCETTLFNVGDTVQITSSKINDGLYVIKEKTDDSMVLDKDVYDTPNMLITKIEYPLDLIDGCVELLDWECNYKDKQGLSSETISRHSVSYKNYDENNTIEGYPSELFNFAKKYTRWIT